MPRRNKIKQLPQEVRDEIHRLIDEEWTFDDIVAHLKTLHVDVSRSGVHRYTQEYKQLSAELRSTREAAEQLARDLGAVETDDSARLLIELLQTIMFKAGSSIARGESALDASDILALARGLDHLSRAKGKTIDIERRARDEATAAAAETAATAMSAAGLSQEVVDQIKAQVLGRAA